MLGGEGVDAVMRDGGAEVCDAVTLFHANDAILDGKGEEADLYGEQKDANGDDDPPEMRAGVVGPVADRDGDGEDNVREKDGLTDEVEDGVIRAVALVRLFSRHGRNCNATLRGVKGNLFGVG